MKNYIKFGVLFLMLIATKSFANNDVNIVLQNQYNAKAKTAVVHVNNDTTTHIPDVNGAVILNTSVTDTIHISGDEYVSTSVAVKDIQTNNIITVKKKFSWKDLLTPMFYIINGVLWFL
jgi:hypothetical protein